MGMDFSRHTGDTYLAHYLNRPKLDLIGTFLGKQNSQFLRLGVNDSSANKLAMSARLVAVYSFLLHLGALVRSSK